MHALTFLLSLFAMLVPRIRRDRSNRPGPAPLCPLAPPARHAVRRLVSGAHLRPRVERAAFEGLVVLALEFQHAGRPAAWPYATEGPSAQPSAAQKRALRVIRDRCRQFVLRAKTVRRVTAAGGRSADKVARLLEETYKGGGGRPGRPPRRRGR